MAHDAHKRIHNPHKQLQNANPQLNELLPVTSRVPTLRTAVRLVVMFQMRCLVPSLNKGGVISDIYLFVVVVVVVVVGEGGGGAPSCVSSMLRMRNFWALHFVCVVAYQYRLQVLTKLDKVACDLNFS
jgi:hypothetical protein